MCVHADNLNLSIWVCVYSCRSSTKLNIRKFTCMGIVFHGTFTGKLRGQLPGDLHDACIILDKGVGGWFSGQRIHLCSKPGSPWCLRQKHENLVSWIALQAWNFMKFYLDGLLFVFQNVGYDYDAANIDILVSRSQNLEWPRLVVLCGNHSVLWCNCIYLYIVLYIPCCCSISLIYQY